MSANVITLTRIILAIITLVMFTMGFFWRVSAVIITMLVFYMDALDGIVARKLGIASDFGALFDITGDRIVEHVYWIFFTAAGMVSMWVPIIFISRSFLVDTVRSVAFSKEGKTPFGEKSMMRSNFTLFLTSGRFMRGTYGFLKLFTFFLLGCVLIFEVDDGLITGVLSEHFLQGFMIFTTVSVWITTAACLLRGFPVLWDGRIYLFEKYYPRELKDAG
ncbi:CDP-alcohol phosphatidyltransferase family protein [candidate division KSB1 bacterium]